MTDRPLVLLIEDDFSIQAIVEDALVSERDVLQ